MFFVLNIAATFPLLTPKRPVRQAGRGQETHCREEGTNCSVPWLFGFGLTLFCNKCFSNTTNSDVNGVKGNCDMGGVARMCSNLAVKNICSNILKYMPFFTHNFQKNVFFFRLFDPDST